MALEPLSDLGEPLEDAGALTQSRFRYQCECIAAVCIAMLVRDEIESVTCEWHEDYIISFRGGQLELVSVKHRESGRGPWSLNELCTRGGLIHLFDRWRLARANSTCRISTNAGLKTGPHEADELATACARVQSGEPGAEEEIAQFGDLIVDVLLSERQRQSDSSAPGGKESTKRRGRRQDSRQLRIDEQLDPAVTALRNEMCQFLACLQIESDLPPRSYISSHNILKLMAPALVDLGRDDADAEACYNTLLPKIEQANRDHDSQPRSMAAYLANPRRLAFDSQMIEKIGRRTLTRTDVKNCLVSRHSAGVRLTSLPASPTVNLRSSRLVKKMQAGGLGPTAVNAAVRLRSHWIAAWAEFRTDLPGDAAELADLKARVAHLAALAEAETRPAESYGVEMNRLLATLLHPEKLGRQFPMRLDPLHLLGLAYELCDECLIWFSEPFELEAG
ncbi:hypothetical protein Psi02_77130 [Planotetraspora silvatica]|uniref:CD-NTase associated protein 4-like DNA endonuclease domain-containing protein n=1 Tax=Planotetraspora silvatica TaxID=234614 RepID=A0A8J3XSJ6_9ACTN|nr:hypothetical protein Psi02_77130 [Planotetraspora silvatica]